MGAEGNSTQETRRQAAIPIGNGLVVGVMSKAGARQIRNGGDVKDNPLERSYEQVNLV